MKKHFVLILLTVLLMPSLSNTMEIRQGSYRYQMSMARDITCITFVIGDFDEPVHRVAAVCRSILVHFQLGSAVLTSVEAKSILSRLKACGITRSTPLVITGYTCKLGPDQLNQTLSLQRARAVADFLQNHGFAAAAVQGRGSQHSLTDNPDDFYKNRRVEIQVLASEDKITTAPGS
jgi:outer membrane protein OmpA-like peptidoglycan-associated protein